MKPEKPLLIQTVKAFYLQVMEKEE